MFRTPLHVVHLNGNRWQLKTPLVWEGRKEYFVMMGGFETDFASIPKPVRWLLDSAGNNSEAAVLHDAVWRESQRVDSPARVDPWDADGMFRSSLRDTGSIALTRGLMWFAVRTTAMVHGRFGKGGPKSLAVKVLQVAGIFVIGVFTAALPTVIAAIGLVIYWIASWIVALVWQLFERLYIKVKPNWPWPLDQKPKRETEPVDKELLVIIPNPADPPDPRAVALRELLKTPDTVTNDAIEKIMAGAP